jgi:hypothetical protein
MKLPPDRRADDPRDTTIWRRRDLVQQGLNDREIRRLVRGGELTRIRPGAYVALGDWERLDPEGRFVVRGRAVLRQAKTPLVLSHASALAEFGAPLWGVALEKVHTTRTDGLSGRRASDVCQHEGQLRPDEVVVVNGVLVTSPARAVIETATCAPAEVGLCVANHALHERWTTVAELEQQYVGMEQWPDSRSVELVLRLADGRIESVGESRTLWVCFHEGLPMPIPQYVVRDEAGRTIGRVDFAWPELAVFLEFDGRVKYEDLLRPGERASDVVLRERDRERLICETTGWVCVRVSWADLARPAQLAARIRAAMDRRTRMAS